VYTPISLNKQEHTMITGTIPAHQSPENGEKQAASGFIAKARFR